MSFCVRKIHHVKLFMSFLCTTNFTYSKFIMTLLVVPLGHFILAGSLTNHQSHTKLETYKNSCTKHIAIHVEKMELSQALDRQTKDMTNPRHNQHNT